MWRVALLGIIAMLLLVGCGANPAVQQAEGELPTVTMFKPPT